MKRNPMLNQKQLEVISNPDKTLTQLCINEGVNLFVEANSADLKEDQ